MGQPRAGKRVVVISSDEEDSSNAQDDILSEDEVKGDTVRADKKPDKRETTGQSKSKTASKPAKSKAAAPPAASKRTKSAAKAESKDGKGTIFSFFNAATQKQQVSQPPTSQPIRTVPADVEHIDDAIDEDDVEVSLAPGSQIALAQRKRKLKQHNHMNIEDGQDAPSATQKFLKASNGTKIPARVVMLDQRPWTEQYGPTDLSELAVHKKKVADVRSLLEEAVSPRARPRLIVLKGSAGTGKTTTINLLAKDLGLEILEWKNPVGADFSNEAFVSASTQFADFVLRSGRFAGLDLFSDDMEGGFVSGGGSEKKPPDQDRSQIMLIEEFPNTFSRSSNVLQSFRGTIQQYLAAPVIRGQRIAPIVMVISETLLSTNTAAADSFTAHRLLGPNILTHPLTAEIEFNAVAPTILTKALETIVVKESRKSGRRKTPGPQVLKRIAETGDVRSAISSLEFLCLRGDDGESWSAKVAFTKSKKPNRETPLTKQEQDALKLISNRESTLGIFHAVGKVMYNKRLPAPEDYPQPPGHLPQYRKPKIPETDVEGLIVELGTDTSTFVAALHENYALSCSSLSSEEFIDSLNGCVDALSDADLLAPDRFSSGTRSFSGSAQDNLRQDDMSFQTAVRGLLFNLPYPVTRSSPAAGKKGDAHRMFYPTSLKLWKRREEIEGVLDLVLSSLQNGVDTETKTASTGVENWKRNPGRETSTTNEDEDEDEDTATTTPLMSNMLGSSARTEMLLERLPYMTRILNHKSNNTSASLRERIAQLTIIEGVAPAGPDDDDAEADQDDAVIAATDWTTDQAADGEDGLDGRRKKRGPGGASSLGFGKGSSKGRGGKIELEGGGLNIPVEHEIERLVLSDDDIVD